MESLPNGMDILGDSCVRLNLPKNGTEKLLKRSQETQLKVNGERTPAPWKDLNMDWSDKANFSANQIFSESTRTSLFQD